MTEVNIKRLQFASATLDAADAEGGFNMTSAISNTYASLFFQQVAGSPKTKAFEVLETKPSEQGGTDVFRTTESQSAGNNVKSSVLQAALPKYYAYEYVPWRGSECKVTASQNLDVTPLREKCPDMQASSPGELSIFVINEDGSGFSKIPLGEYNNSDRGRAQSEAEFRNAQREDALIAKREQQEKREKGYIVHSFPDPWDHSKTRHWMDVLGGGYIDLGRDGDFTGLTDADLSKLARDSVKPMTQKDSGIVVVDGASDDCIVITRDSSGEVTSMMTNAERNALDIARHIA